MTMINIDWVTKEKRKYKMFDKFVAKRAKCLWGWWGFFVWVYDVFLFKSELILTLTLGSSGCVRNSIYLTKTWFSSEIVFQNFVWLWITTCDPVRSRNLVCMAILYVSRLWLIDSGYLFERHFTHFSRYFKVKILELSLKTAPCGVLSTVYRPW